MKIPAVFAKTLTAAAFALTAPLAPALAQDPAVISEEYVLGPGDIVEVNVLGRDDFKTRARVNADGTILLPFIGQVRAADGSTSELSKQVAAALQAGGYFANPVVSVDIASYASRYVTVLGHVGTSGLVPIDRAYRLSEILARVGGTKETAGPNVILTSANGTERRLPIMGVATGTGENDPIVSPGDKIYVPQAEQFFIYGHVKAPGAFPIMEEPTLRKALAQGGGLSATGSERKIQIFRNGQKVRANPSDPIRPGDVIVIGERLF